ncbi:hypothetical protein [Streptomyces sp. NPDC127100]|uniref:hypothetical protein n=1 Tax=Streptomyces sp. NPDC127100 TaxID=3347138 RepID=UPI003654DDC1
MTKAGSDYLKNQAREIRRTTGRRLPDILAELRAPRRTPSKELVPLCKGFAHPIDGGRCAQVAGHPGHWTWCGSEPHFAVHVWQGYVEARNAAEHAKHEAWLVSLTPKERTEYEAEQEAAHWAQMAEDAREPYDPDEERAIEFALDAADEERWEAQREAEMAERADDDGYVDLTDDEYYGYYADEDPR